MDIVTLMLTMTLWAFANADLEGSGEGGGLCDCAGLRQCLIQAHSPCWAWARTRGGPDSMSLPSEGPTELWVRQRRRDPWRSSCARQWRRVHLIDPLYRHIGFAVACLQQKHVCYATLEPSKAINQSLDARSSKCSAAADNCQRLYAADCDKFDFDAHWRECWRDNPLIKAISPSLVSVLESAWRCEALQELDRNDEDLLSHL